MQTKKPTSENNWSDPDDAPHLGREWFDHAEIKNGEQVLRAAKVGRPKSASPKQAVNIRLDADLLEYFRATGPGWQSRVNEALRKVSGL